MGSSEYKQYSMLTSSQWFQFLWFLGEAAWQTRCDLIVSVQTTAGSAVITWLVLGWLAAPIMLVPICWKYPNNFVRTVSLIKQILFPIAMAGIPQAEERAYGYGHDSFCTLFPPPHTPCLPCFPTGWVLQVHNLIKRFTFVNHLLIPVLCGVSQQQSFCL